MNQQDNFDAFLSRQLSAKQPYLADEGFAEQVVAALPGRRASKSWWQRPITLVPVLLVSVLVVGQLPLVDSAIQLWHFFFTADQITLLKTGAAVSAACLLASFGWLAREMGLV